MRALLLLALLLACSQDVATPHPAPAPAPTSTYERTARTQDDAGRGPGGYRSPQGANARFRRAWVAGRYG